MAVQAPSSAAPTPPHGPLMTSDHYANYVPHDLKYSPTFEDDLLALVLHGPAPNTTPGIRILSLDSTEEPEIGVSVRVSDVRLESLPTITEDELPLPINDPRRIFSSPIAGLNLTHPNGYLEGGPGLHPNLDTFTDDFLSNHTPRNHRSSTHHNDPTVLRAAVDAEIQSSIALLKQRMRERGEAKRKNDEVEKKLRELRQGHDMELRVHNKMAEDIERRKAAKAAGGGRTGVKGEGGG
ncbi:hypothetical protein LTR78_005479 [Recurvomyces mirabilis]|uniref:Uncharacterized protein n=2 Tax=Recurvomyces mirabilis TaxID=574656 RepID=A0AAE1C1U0_9PEZI|nr:hypothetical protein LTR78_005479 [Recurvomyces mirabilis]